MIYSEFAYLYRKPFNPMKKFLTLALSLLAFSQLDAQVRYLNEVFTDVNVTTDVVYGTNVTVLPCSKVLPPRRSLWCVTSTSLRATRKWIVL